MGEILGGQTSSAAFHREERSGRDTGQQHEF
jgi:hypothetical protein